jgi:tetratricopeptide (TPR) repeat protein
VPSSLFLIVMVSVGQMFAATPAAARQARNVIEGTVTAGGRPLKDARVFLQNDGYAQVAMAYTDSSGRFRFQGLTGGVYYVEVDPAGAEYERQTQRVEAVPFSARGDAAGETFRVTFQLTPRKGAEGASAEGPGVSFYQEVPEAARREFAQGRRSLERGDFDAAFAALGRAVELFPDYYDALELLGTERVRRGEYEQALPPLERAVAVNRNGWRGFYSLGVALSELKRKDEALAALRRAAELNPRSPNTNMRLGMALAPDPAARAEAIKVFKKVIELDEKRVPDAYLYLGRLQDLEGRGAEAVGSLRAYARLAPRGDAQVPQALLYLAEMLGRQKRYAEAAEAVEASLRAAPQTAQRDKLIKLAEQLRQKAAQTK